MASGVRVFSSETNLSDSQTSFYVESLRKILATPELGSFRRNFNYREILEHVNFSTGKAYINRISELGYSIEELIALGINNDRCGRPRVYRYGRLPEVSPTTLRYLSVACELEKTFGSLDGMNILEIGAGYGGQMSIIARMFKIKSYSIYDLSEAQSLINKYANEIELPITPKMLDINNIENTSFDLVISNYAFSELPREVQIEYAQKTLRNSRKGYMIMNSGLRNKTTRSDGKLKYEELNILVPEMSVIEEIPLTSVDNYIILWGQTVDSR